jgi:hypothetical protein
MLLKELFEDDGKHVSFCFGRMNPPTIGHAEVFKKLKSIGGDYKIFVTMTQDKKENPLDYLTKTKFIKLIHPEYADSVVVDTNLNTIGKVCSYLYDLGYRNATFVAGSDRLPSFQKLITDYNGVEGKGHGYYKFDVLDFESSGQRDPDSPGVSGISASKAREKAVAGDLAGFEEATGAGEYAKPLYDAVRKGMGIKESYEESLDEVDRRGFLKGLGAAALAGAGMASGDAKADGPLPVMATIKFKLPNGEIKTIKKDLGNSYDYRLDDAKRDLENLLDKKGIKNYTIHLDRYKGDEVKTASTKDTDYMQKTPSTGQPSDRDYMDKGPYTAKHSSASYMDRSKEKEFRDMGNY